MIYHELVKGYLVVKGRWFFERERNITSPRADDVDAPGRNISYLCTHLRCPR